MAHNHYVLATSLSVMAGLVPAIPAFVSAKTKNVDARVKPA
jgi:SH3-like domain-containing protein